MSVVKWKGLFRRSDEPKTHIELSLDALIAAYVAFLEAGESSPGSTGFSSRGLVIRNRSFKNPVVLCSRRLSFKLDFIDCAFSEYVDVRWAEFDALTFSRCHFAGPLLAEAVRVRGHLDLTESTLDGGADLAVAHIDGDVKLRGSSLRTLGGDADTSNDQGLRSTIPFFAGGLKVHSILMEHAKVSGCMFLDAATIGGIIKATSAEFDSSAQFKKFLASPRKSQLRNWAHVALSAADATIRGAVILGEESRALPVAARSTARFRSNGQLAFTNCRIGGDLVLTGAEICSLFAQVNADTAQEFIAHGDDAVLAAVHASRAKIDGAVFLNQGFRSLGEVRFNSTSISGVLRCEGASMDCTLAGDVSRRHDGLTPASSRALGLSRAHVGNSLFLSAGFHAVGVVDLRNSRIDGNLDCSGGKFVGVGHGGYAAPESLSASGATVSGHVFLSIAKDAPRASRGTLPVADAISDERHRFVSIGQVRLRGGTIGGNLHLEGGVFAPAESSRSASSFELPPVLLVQTMSIKGTTFLTDERHQPPGFASPIRLAGSVSFEDTHTLVWEDSEDVWANYWNAERGCTITLDGLSYERLRGPLAGPKRLIWLLQQPTHDLIRSERHDISRVGDDASSGFKTQPWEQCARVLYKAGYRRDARYLLRMEQHFLRTHGRLNHFERAYSMLLGLLVGHGFRPYYALLWALILTAFGGVVFDFGSRHSQFVATEPRVMLSPGYAPGSSVPKHYPALEPFIYSLDVVLPVIDLDQESYWIPTDLALNKSVHPQMSSLQHLNNLVKKALDGVGLMDGPFEKFLLVTVGVLLVGIALYRLLGDEVPQPRSFSGNRNRELSKKWLQLYRWAVGLGRPAWRRHIVHAWNGVVMLAAGMLLVSALVVGAAIVDLSMSDRLLSSFDYGARTILGIGFVHFWVMWQTLWGWLLISAVVAGASGAVFRQPIDS